MTYSKEVFILPQKIAVVGSSFLDFKGYPEGEINLKKNNYGKIDVSFGGVGRNIAENLGKLSVSSSFISTIDNNSFGMNMKEQLEEIGVDTTFLLPINSGGMGRWMSLIDKNGYLISAITQVSDISHLEKYIDKYGEKFAKEFEVLLLELDLSEKISKKIIGSFKKNKGKVFIYSANMENPYNDNSIFEDVECLFLNEKSAEKILSCDISNMEIHQIQKSLKEFIQNNSVKRGIITLYKRGTVFYDNVLNQSSFIEESEGGSVNLVGEGEMLFSMVTVNLLKDLPLKDAVRMEK
jgi:pseudouridine kinase